MLVERFEAARERNPSYSLRAFARSLKIDHSTLSRIMTGKRPVSEAIARKIAARLEIVSDGDQIATDPSFRELNLEEHILLSSWVAASIQELTRVKGFKPDADWIAKKLQLPKGRIQEIIDTLFRLGFMKQLENGKWVDQVDYWYSPNFDNHPDSKKENSRAIAELNRVAERRHGDLSEELCSFSRVTVAGSADQMQKAKKLIARFRKDLLAVFASRKRDPEQVYVAQIELFPVTSNE